MLTQTRLKELLHYDTESGIFTWIKIKVSNQVKVGDKAGSLKSSGYTEISIDGKKYKAHRLAFLYINGRMPTNIDHINHKCSDNRLINLREVSHQDNCKNRSIRSDNKYGVVGVSWKKQSSKWYAYISNNGKVVHLGYFDEFSEAVNARKNAEVLYKYHKNHGKDL